MESNEIEIRIIILGDSGVGKTSIFSRFAHGKFDENSMSTIGLTFKKKEYNAKDGKTIVLKLVDTGGEEKYRAITKSYYKNADGVFFVLAHNDKESFDHIIEWIASFDENSSKGDIPKLLIGNKNDLPKFEENEESFNVFCKGHNIYNYISTSAKDNINIDKAFKEMVEKIYPNIKNSKGHHIKKVGSHKQKGQCCVSKPDT